jgi:Ribosomal protein L16p/L10e
MGKGKGAFDHYCCKVAAGQILFELVGDIRPEIAKDALQTAGHIISGPTRFVSKANLREPAVIGLYPSPVYHAGIPVEGTVDKKKRLAEAPPVVESVQIGFKKTRQRQRKKGLVRMKS